MAVSIFGFSFGGNKEERMQVQEKESNNLTISPVPPQNDDGSYVVDASTFGFASHLLDLDGMFTEEAQCIRTYREISMYSEVDLALNDIVNEAIVTDEFVSPVRLVLDNLDFSDDLKNKIRNEFDKVLSLLNFNSDAQDIFRRWYIDGRLYYQIIIDKTNPRAGIKELRMIDAIAIKKIREETKRRRESGVEEVTAWDEYYIYTPRQTILGIQPQQMNGASKIQQGTSTVGSVKLSKDSVVYVHSGIQDMNRGFIVSYLHKAIKPINMLRMIEDALVIYRLARAPERRVFYIDVGNLPKGKAEQYLKGIMLKFKNRMVYDAVTGNVKDNMNQLSMMEDFWLPRREGGKSTEITTLPGAQNLSQIEDIQYFLKKMYKSLGVPVSRIESETNFNFGRPSEISRDELNFAKFVNRLRKRFSELLYELLRIQLTLKNVIRTEDWVLMKEVIGFDFIKDSFFSELKDSEILKERLNTLALINPYVGEYYSIEYIKKNVLRQSDEEIKMIAKQNSVEKKDGSQEPDNMPFNPELQGIGMSQQQMDMQSDQMEVQNELQKKQMNIQQKES